MLSVDCLLAETIAQFRSGFVGGYSGRGKYIKQFLCGPRFQPQFTEKARLRFYEDIRCGLLHQAEAKRMWLVRRDRPTMLDAIGLEEGYIIDVQRFHAAVRLSFEDYCDELVNPSQSELRVNLWKKMDEICRFRKHRGLTIEASTETRAPE